MPAGGTHGFSPGYLRRARSERDISLRDLALLLDLSTQAVTAWERGTSSPSPKHLAALAEVLRVSVDDLIRIPITEAELASLRDRAGLTGADVAAALETHRSAWSEIEQGYRRLPARLVPPLSALLGRTESEVTQAWERARTNATRRARN